MRIEPLNEQSCILRFSDEISDEIADQIAWATHQLQESLGTVITDMIPSYTTIVIFFDTLQISRQVLYQHIEQVLSCESGVADVSDTGILVTIPVYYGEEVALDMAEVCEYTRLSPEKIIRLHSHKTYRVYAVGFTPGFAYSGTLDDGLCIPRKVTPRLKVPEGSVGLADNQTAVYPGTSPGGWQIIGRTPLKMFDRNRDDPGKLHVGDRVEFLPVDRNTFLAMGGRLDEL